MYEHKKQPLLPGKLFLRRLLDHILIALGAIAVCLGIGMVGYHLTSKVPWIDAFHNSSMILSGIGPVIEFHTTGGKLFSSFYALFSGIVFIAISGVVLAPVIHRLFHRLHFEK
jgi:putative Mn2+ efflux pump MntP